MLSYLKCHDEIFCTCHMWLWLSGSMQWVMYPISGFVDDVRFSHNEAYADNFFFSWAICNSRELSSTYYENWIRKSHISM